MDSELLEKHTKHSYDGAAMRLIILTAITYLVSYIGRKSWNSNLNELMEYFGKGEGEIGIVGTCFFIVYAVGQVVHGFLCKFYNPKWVVFGALITAAVVNFVIGILPPNMFWLVPIIWSINGFFMASLWSIVIRMINIHLAKKHIKTSLFVLSFPVAVGTLCTYVLSAIFSAIKNFHLSFFTAAGLLLINAIVWLLSTDSLIDKCDAERIDLEGENNFAVAEDKKEKKKKEKVGGAFWVVFGILCFFAIVDNLLKDGIMDWTPTFLKETYGLENWKSVLITVVIPCVAILGSLLALNLHKKIKDYIVLSGLFFSVVSIILICLIISLDLKSWILPFASLVVTYALMSAINNVITSIYPMQCDKRVNAGMIAGLTDGFCYVGSAISSYGIGNVIESKGFTTVFYIFDIAALLCAFLSLGLLILNRVKAEKQ